VSIVVFEDLECPFCRRFHEGPLAQVRTRYGDSIAPILVHYPLPSIHRFASVAARSLECADKTSHAREFMELAHARQDSFGLLSWGELARRAGVPDTVAFNRCVEGNERLIRIERGIQIGNKIGVKGTPTVIVNGLRFDLPPSERQLVAAIDSILGRERNRSVGR
jgi:Na+:H+ antiporter, NhaA family